MSDTPAQADPGRDLAFPLEMRGQDRHARRERALEVIRLVGTVCPLAALDASRR